MPARQRLIAVVDEPDLRRALIRRNIAERAVQIAVVQLARNARGHQHIDPMLRRDQIRSASVSSVAGACRLRRSRTIWLASCTSCAYSACRSRRMLAVRDRFENRATGFMQMMAVVEAAVRRAAAGTPETRAPAGLRSDDAGRTPGSPANRSARRLAVRARQRIQPREGRRVPAAVQCRRDFARRDFGIGNQQIHAASICPCRTGRAAASSGRQMFDQRGTRGFGLHLRPTAPRPYTQARDTTRAACARRRARSVTSVLFSTISGFRLVRLGRDQRAPEQVLAEMRLGGRARSSADRDWRRTAST